MKVDLKKDEGWNEIAFYDIGLLDVVSELDDLAYEIRNCVRVNSLEDMAMKLRDAAENLQEIADQIEDNIDS